MAPKKINAFTKFIEKNLDLDLLFVIDRIRGVLSGEKMVQDEVIDYLDNRGYHSYATLKQVLGVDKREVLINLILSAIDGTEDLSQSIDGKGLNHADCLHIVLLDWALKIHKKPRVITPGMYIQCVEKLIGSPYKNAVNAQSTVI